jgi:protocatechuate 3,4-dioxygenase beta subunit
VQALRRTFIVGRHHFLHAAAGMTDDRGFYRLAGLTPGDYVVVAPPAPNAILVYPTVYYPAAGVSGQATVLKLHSGDERAGIDLQLKAARGARITGTLLGPDGAISGTPVRLVPAPSEDNIDPFDVASTQTDAVGHFTLTSVPPGEYVLHVLRVTRLPAGTDVTFVARAPLPVGDRDIDDLVVPLSAGPRVSGRIEFDGAAERPPAESITGVRIALDPADGSRLAVPTLADETGRPDESGQFRTYGVPPGRYVLRISPLPAGWFLKSAMHQGRDIADVPFDLESRDVSGVVIALTDRPSAIAGIVSGPQGPDASGVVLIYPADSAAWGTSPRRMRTARAAADGSYSVQALPPGEYFVAAVQEDRVGDWQDPEFLQALSRVAHTVRLVEGEQKTENLTSAAIR